MSNKKHSKGLYQQIDEGAMAQKTINTSLTEETLIEVLNELNKNATKNDRFVKSFIELNPHISKEIDRLIRENYKNLPKIK